MIKLNGTVLNFSKFPNGETKMDETQIIEETGDYNNVFFTYEDDSDLIKLMLVRMYLGNLGVKSQLSISYMPYSRMDRTRDNSAFTLQYVADFINALKFDAVTIFEPHSDVTPALILNCRVVYPSIEILEHVKKEIGFDEFHDVIYLPDSGAEKRYSSMIAVRNSVVGIKHRNFETGRIERLRIVGDIPYKNFKAIMIDDLCSYGGTFVMGAKALQESGASEIYVIVTHCENSIYSGEVFKSGLINKVYTTNSIIRKDEDPTFESLVSYELTLQGKLKGEK